MQNDQFDINIVGFSVCAGYLSAICGLLRSKGNMSDDDLEASFENGKERVLRHYRQVRDARLQDSEYSK